MSRFLIDANLPYRFSLWRGEDYQHAFDLGDDLSDQAIWEYAKHADMVIVTKDADFSDWIMLSDPPPRVVHFRVGNMRLRDFHVFVQQLWPQVCRLIASHKLIIIRTAEIECVA